MIRASQIREIVSNFLSHGDGDRFVFEFSRLSYNIHKNGDPDAVVIANLIESKMADLNAGGIAKNQFLYFLWVLIQESLSSNSHLSPSQFFNSVNRPVAAGMPCPVFEAASGTSPEVVFGSAHLLQS
jgi:hypothetical protein